MDFGYDTNPLDPQEEERKREAALSALAAAGGAAPDMPVDRAAPVELPAQVSPPASDIDLGQPDIAGSPNTLPDPTPSEIPDPQLEGQSHNSAAFGALADAGRLAREEPTPETPPPGAAPTKGLDSANASPQMKEIVNPDQGTKKTEPPPAPDPWEALMRRGEEQRQKQLEAYDKNGPPGVNGWALLADVAFNHGRSIPQILQQADAEKGRYEEGRRKLLTGGANADPINQMLALDRLKVARGREDRLLDHETAAQAGKDAAAAQGKTNREGMLSYLKDRMPAAEYESLLNVDEKTLGRLLPQIRQEYGYTDEMVDKKANVEKAKANARATGTAEGEYAHRDEKAGTAGAVRAAQVDEEMRALPSKPQTPDQIAADVLQRESLDESKRIRTEAAAARKEDKNRSWITEYGNKHTKQIDTAKLVDELDDVIASAEQKKTSPPGLGVEQLKEGADKYPLGQTARGIAGLVGSDSYNKFQSEADYNRKLLNRLAESVYRIDTGASGNEREEMRAAIASATSPLAKLEDIKNSIKILRSRLNSQLGNVAAAAPVLAAQSLAGGGIRDPGRWLGQIQRPARQDPTLAPGQSVTIDPETGDEVVDGATADVPKPPKLKVTGGPRSSPAPIPMQPPAARDYQKMLEEDADLGVSYGR